MKKTKLITLEWEIHDTRDVVGGYRTGTSRLQVKAKNTIEAVNDVIRFAEHLPSWELERNNINEKEYIDGCQPHYTTRLSKILKIENVEQGE